MQVLLLLPLVHLQATLLRLLQAPPLVLLLTLPRLLLVQLLTLPKLLLKPPLRSNIL
jgi:hypothetical protein